MWRYTLALALVACLSVSAQSREYARSLDLDWVDYRNESFGLTLRYPASVFEFERSAEAGDGQLFISKDGRARLLVGALQNSDRHSPRSYQTFISHKSYPGFEIDYAPIGRTWTVLSGKRDGTMFYEKVMFSCGGTVINSFAMLYPVEHRRAYDAIVEEIEDTFRVSSKGCG